MSKVTEKELVMAAEELNEVLGLDPSIPTKDQDLHVLAEALETAAGLIEEGDELTEETLKMLDTIKSGEWEEVEEEVEERVEKIPSKKKKSKTKLGSRIGTQAEKIDIVLLSAENPLTVKEIADKSGFSTSRIKTHLNHLIKKKGMNLSTGNNEYQVPK